MSKRLVTIVAAVLGLLLFAVALLSAVVSGFSAPHWVPPAGGVCTAAAVLLTLIP